MVVEEISLLGQIRKQYVDNFLLSISFAILLIFAFFFLQFQNMALFSGSVFFDYSFAQLAPEVVIAQVVAGLLFLSMYAILLTLLILAVRNDLSHIKVHFYLREMVQKFFVVMAVYFVMISVLFVGLVLIGQALAVGVVWVNLVLLVLSLALVFVPQSLVIDEKPIFESIRTNLYVILSHPLDFILVVVVSTVLVGLLPLIEFIVDRFIPIGRFVSIILMFIAVIPVIEILKTILYMRRFELVRGHEYAQKKHPGLRGSITHK